MSDPEVKDTQPTGALHDTQPDVSLGETHSNSLKRDMQPRLAEKKFPRWLVALCVVTLIAIGLLGGYGSGLGQRYAAQNTQVTGQLDEQFRLGTQAVEAGNFELARQYFEGILRTDSNYAGIQAAYTDLLLRMQVTPTPVFSPTPLVSPTPDLRGAEEIYNTALQLLNSSDWNGAITNLDSLRKASPTYRTAEVDGMYYMALRQRGVEKITTGCQDVNLEGGIYDLTLAEHFVGTGNLDSYAESLRTYARFYIIGASFWDQDWLQAQNFFAQVLDGYPIMSDSSCKSATKRWYEATIKVADQLLAAGDTCGAEEQYAAAFTVNDPFNATAYPTATEIANQCDDGGGGDGGAGETPTAAGTPTAIGTPTAAGTPTETPTPCSTDSFGTPVVCP
jgi:tetratricopeptide (TPR) repeat protein